MASSMERASERAQDVLHQSMEYPQQKQEEGQTKQTYQTQSQQSLAHRRKQMGLPELGIIVAGFPSPLAEELTQHCVKNGINVSNIGLGCRGHAEKEFSISGVSKLEVIDCEAPEVRDQLEKARDALEKEGSEVVIVLDVGQDCRTVDLYNRLKLPFVHSGSGAKVDEMRMYEEANASRNPCVIAPFISAEGAALQIAFEAFARLHPGLFRGWSVSASTSLGENNAVAAGQRRMEAALANLIDQDASSFSDWSASSGKTTMSHTGHREQDKQQQLQQQEMGTQEESQKPPREQHQEQHKEQQEGGGFLAKLGLTSAGGKTKEAAQSTAQQVTSSTKSACKASFTLKSPDGKDSISISHEHTGLANIESIVCMADFLADKILKRREPRAWGIKDWVAGENDINRQIVERLEGKSREEQLPGLKYGVKYGRQQQQQQQQRQHQEATVLGERQKREKEYQEQQEYRRVHPVVVGTQIGTVEAQATREEQLSEAEYKAAQAGYGQPQAQYEKHQKHTQHTQQHGGGGGGGGFMGMGGNTQQQQQQQPSSYGLDNSSTQQQQGR